MSKLKCAVVGVGYLGKFHAAKYAALPNVELVAVCDAREAIVKEIASQHNVQAFTDHRELLGKVDAVSIAVPTTLHYEIAKDFLMHKTHVLVEKPITVTVAEAENLIDIARENKCKLQVGHLERFNFINLALGNLVDNPLFIQSDRLAPFNPRGADVNVVLDLMIHDIDLIQNIVASPIESIDASGIPVLSNDIDIANARIRFANGCVANVTASRSSMKSERKLRLFQHNAYISVDLQNKSFKVHKRGEGEMFPGIPEIMTEERVFEQGDALMSEIQAFIYAIENNTVPIVTGTDGRNALETAIRITEMVMDQPYNRKRFADRTEQ